MRTRGHAGRLWLRVAAVTIPVAMVSALSVGVVWAQRAPKDARAVFTAGRAPSTVPPATAPPSSAVTVTTPTTLRPPTTLAATTTTSGTPRAATTRPASPGKPAATAPSSPSSGTDFGPRPPGSVSLPYAPGQHLWTAVSSGITLTLEMEPAAPNAGEAVTFAATATVAPGVLCCYLSLDPMDASTMAWAPVATNSTACTNLTLPTTLRHVTTHTFNKSGRIDFYFEAGILCGNGSTVGSIFSSLDVGPGPSTSQGPLLPVLQADDGRLPAQMHDPTLAVAWATARDDDGHIARFSVDWGDGTPGETFPGDPNACIQDASGWPGSSQEVMGGVSATPPSHRYLTPKPVLITVTVVSTGCDGTDPQQVSATFPWVPPNP